MHDDTPAAIAAPAAAGTPRGSLERGIAGDYQFSIGATLGEAWARTRGAKGTIAIAGLIYFAILLGAGLTLGFIGAFGALTGGDAAAAAGFELVSQLVTTAISMPMAAGFAVIGIQRSVDAPISAGTVLRYFPKILPLLVLTILMYALIAIGFVLLIIPGIYLLVAYYLAVPLLVEKNLGPWRALEASRQAIGKRWFAICGLFLLLALLNVATIFTLFIGMIWTLPMTVIAIGILYRNMFGVEAATVALS